MFRSDEQIAELVRAHSKLCTHPSHATPCPQPCFACFEALHDVGEWVECGSCGGWHPASYFGDCRYDPMRA